MGLVTEHRTTIDGIAYATKTYPASEGLRVMHKLARLIDPSEVGKALLTVDDTELGTFMQDAGFMLALVTSAAKASTADEWPALAKELVRYTICDKCRVGDAEIEGSVHDNFDTHFAGRYKHLLDVCIWSARVGFGAP